MGYKESLPFNADQGDAASGMDLWDIARDSGACTKATRVHQTCVTRNAVFFSYFVVIYDVLCFREKGKSWVALVLHVRREAACRCPCTENMSLPNLL